MNLKLVLVATLMHAGLSFPFINDGGVDRDNIPGLLGGEDPSEEPPERSPQYQTADYYSYGYSYYSYPDQQTTINSGTNPLGGLFMTTATSSSIKTSTPHSTATVASTSPVQSALSISNTATPTPSSTNAATNRLASSGSSDSKTWKVVGVAVIVVTAVMVVILVVVFFDRWTQFLRDMLLGRKRSNGAEFLVPDWEKRSWEVKLPEDDHQSPADPSSFEIAAPVKPKLQLQPPILANDIDVNRHPFALRPGHKLPFESFVSSDRQGSRTADHSYSSLTTAELQRQNSQAAHHAYTAYA